MSKIKETKIKKKKKYKSSELDSMVGRGKAMHALQRLFGFVSREREREQKKEQKKKKKRT